MKPAEGSRDAVELPVETPDHEVRERAVVEEVRVGHVDPGLPRHLRVDVLDAPPRARTAGTPDPLSGHIRREAVELDEPRLLPRLRARESQPHPVRIAVPENQRLRPGTARAAADLHDLRHRHRSVALDDLPGLLHEIPHSQRLLRARIRIHGRMEFQRAHRAFADVAESPKWRHRVSRPPPLLEMATDDGVAELVRQGVGEHSGEPKKRGLPGQLRKCEGPPPTRRHVDRRDVEAGCAERRSVLEGDPPAGLLPQQTDLPTPDPHPHPHLTRHESPSTPAVAPSLSTARHRTGTPTALE